jgi:hypothetical protein
MQQVAGGEISEQQCRARVQQQVAERVVIAVAGEIRDGQALAPQPHEARPPAAMRDIHPRRRRRGDEEGVGGADLPAGFGVQRRQHLQRADGAGARLANALLDGALLDVLRAISETLRDIQHDSALRQRRDAAVGAVAPAGREVDPQHRHRRARMQRGGERVVRRRARGDRERGRIRAGDEAGRAFQQRRPRPVLARQRRRQTGEAGEEPAMLIRHVAADRRPLALHPGQALGRALAGMKRVGGDEVGQGHRGSPVAPAEHGDCTGRAECTGYEA